MQAPLHGRPALFCPDVCFLMKRQQLHCNQPCAGKNFSYTERQQASNVFVALITSFATSLGGLLAYFNLTRKLLLKLAPGPGSGPSRETMEKGSWHFHLLGALALIRSG